MRNKKNTTSYLRVQDIGLLVRRINLALFGVVILLAVLYVYLIGATTVSVSQRKSLQDEIRIAEARVNKLEMTYYDTINGIDISLLSDLQMQNPRAVHFASRESSGPNVALR